MNLEQTIRSVQQALGIETDGKAGPQTWAAIHRRIVGVASDSGDAKSGPAPAADAGPDEAVDERSEKVIATLQPEVRPYARALVHKAAASGIQIKVISGHRSYAEQDALYARGRTVMPGPIVTNARGGYSNHNFGIAFDIGVFEGNRYLGDSPKYRAIGMLGREIGLEWGGSWSDFVDQPHFQLRPAWASNLSGRELLAELREHIAAGTPVFA
jgi:peptidoglycan L-alanyl-D-glutamate endopeptidase CwlK